MRKPPRALQSIGRLIIRLTAPANRRVEIEGDLLELWEQRCAAGGRAPALAYLRDLAGLVRSSRPFTRLAHVPAAPFEIAQDMRYAWRVLWRSPATTLAAIATLAVGIGSSLAIFTALDRLLLNPLPYPEPHRLVNIEKGPVRLGPVAGSLVAKSFRDLPVIEAAGAWAPGGLNLDGGGDVARVAAAVVDDGFFKAMGVPAARGQTLPVPDGSPVVVIAHSLWRNRLGSDPAIVGRTLSFNGQAYTVVGVMPPGFGFPGHTEVWIPPNVDRQVTGGVFGPDLIARIAPGVTLEQARAVIDAYDGNRRAQHGGPADDAIVMTPLSAELTGRVRPTMMLLAASAALLLVAVCASVANLLLARVAARDQELVVRRALGATRWRLTRLLLTESLLLSIAGAGAGVLLAMWGLQTLRALVPDALDAARMAIDARFAAVAIAATLVTALAFGIAPGLAAATRESGDVVRAGRQELRSRFWGRVRSALISAQMAAALVLLTASAAGVAALVDITRIDPGFGGTRAVGLTVTLPIARFSRTAIPGFVARARERLAAVPGVVRVGATGGLPDSREMGSAYRVSRAGVAVDPAAPAQYARYLRATPDYFEAMGIRLVSGRTFSDTDRTGAPRVVILSESCARTLFADAQAAIGERIIVGRGETAAYEVAGVVRDVHFRGLSRDGYPHLYVPLELEPPWGGLSFVVQADAGAADIIPALRTALREVDASIPVYDVRPIDEIVDQYTASHRMAGTLISAFAIVTLVVAAIGLYGLMAQLVTERTREIAIRMALGAAAPSVRLRLLRFGVLHAAAGAAAGLVASSAAVALFGAVVPGLAPPPAYVIGVNVLVLLVTAVTAVWIPASRILRLDPIASLRQ